MRRALAPLAVAISDEGNNGLAIHAFNDRAEPWAGELSCVLFRGETAVGNAEHHVQIRAHSAIEIAMAQLFDGWMDLSFAYRFGPPLADVVHVQLGERDTFWFPAGLPATRESDVGLAVTVEGTSLAISTRRFAQSVAIEARGVIVADNYFHLAPGQTRTVQVPAGVRGTITALNSERTIRFEVPGG